MGFYRMNFALHPETSVKRQPKIRGGLFGIVFLVVCGFGFFAYSMVSADVVIYITNLVSNYLYDNTPVDLVAISRVNIDYYLYAETFKQSAFDAAIFDQARQAIFESVRNISHFICFFIMTLIIYYVLKTKRRIVIAVTVSVSLAVLSEVVQKFAELRGESMVDIYFNLFGIVTAVFFIVFTRLFKLLLDSIKAVFGKIKSNGQSEAV